MTPAQFQRLQRQWDAKLRAEGMGLEAPSGMVPKPLSHGVSTKRTRALAQLEQDRELTPRLRFEGAWEERAWALHLEGVSNRNIAAKLCLYRKLVDETFARLRKQARPRGRRRDPESLRSEGLQLHCLLTPEAREAFLYLQRTLAPLRISEIVRAALVGLARKTREGAGAYTVNMMYIDWKKVGANEPKGHEVR